MTGAGEKEVCASRATMPLNRCLQNLLSAARLEIAPAHARTVPFGCLWMTPAVQSLNYKDKELASKPIKERHWPTVQKFQKQQLQRVHLSRALFRLLSSLNRGKMQHFRQLLFKPGGTNRGALEHELFPRAHDQTSCSEKEAPLGQETHWALLRDL